MSRAILALTAVAVAALGAQKQFVEMNRDDLVRAEPALADIAFEPDEQGLATLLPKVGSQVAGALDGLGKTCMLENIRALRFDGFVLAARRRKEFLYCAERDAGSGTIREYRASPRTSERLDDNDDEVLVAGGFLQPLVALMPSEQARRRFRRLGTIVTGGRKLDVLAFAGNEPQPSPQGLIWVDAATSAVIRIRVDDAGRQTSVFLTRVEGGSPPRPVLAPATVAVHSRRGLVEYHNVHRFSAYLLDGDGTPRNAQLPPVQDAWELLEEAVASGEPAKALGILQAAVRIDPNAAPVRFHLAVALWKSNDVAAAETQARAAAELAPDAAAAHNLLGIILGRRDPKGAAAELKIAARQEPANAVVQANLGEALYRIGDHAAAVEAYRQATTLDPENDAVKARYEQLAKAAEPILEPSRDPGTIRVNVRQVLVPVVVTDGDGRHVSGLKRDDFQVTENGVEQKIAAFEEVRVGTSEGPLPDKPLEAARETGSRAVRRTYVLCIDSLHSSHANLVGVRKALEGFFASERGGDTQYALMIAGRSMRILQNTTTDPDVVLKAVRSRDFENAFLEETKTSHEEDIRQYRRELDQARALCGAKDRRCPAEEERAAQRARAIAAEYRNELATFLWQLRGVIDQLGQRTDRRDVVLLSDGFEMVPGRLAFELLAAYFPRLPGAMLATIDRQQLLLDPVLSAATARNVAVHTIDTRGLYADSYYDVRNSGRNAGPASLSAMARSERDSGATLVEIAGATGGTAFQNSNDIGLGLRKSFNDGREYYTLAYTPANPASDGKFRKISVRLRDRRPVTLRSKRGYWAVADAEAK